LSRAIDVWTFKRHSRNNSVRKLCTETIRKRGSPSVQHHQKNDRRSKAKTEARKDFGAKASLDQTSPEPGQKINTFGATGSSFQD
jgi:hypothetical protein